MARNSWNPRNSRNSRERHADKPQLNGQPPAELDFESDDSRSARVGHRRSDAAIREEFPAARERQAGMTGGEVVGGGITADDLAPETLLDGERSRSPAAGGGRLANDAALSEQDLDEESYEDEHVRKRRL